VYQLYELAIENQYIQVDDIKQRAQKELTDLLWSEGSRSYLLNYCYISVVYLAQRVGVNLGFKQVQLPSIRQGTEGRFASFLSQHAVWYEDPLLDGWIGFLDDYQEYGDKKLSDKEVFWDFLRTTKREFKDEAALWALVAGADRFVTRLADFVGSLSEEERPSYGQFYGYWLSKFYGYDLSDKGYVRDKEQEDWSTALKESQRLAYFGGKSQNVSENVLEAFRLREAVVRKFWLGTAALLNSNPIVIAS
jgi:hypothetical protein